MPGKRITELTALTGAETAGDDDLLIFDTNANETKRISRLQLAVGIQDDIATLVPRFVGTRTALKALNTNIHTTVYLTEAGREGTFVFRAGDYSTEVTADTAEGIYIEADDTAASSGAWVRVHNGSVSIAAFGSVTSSTAHQAAWDASNDFGVGIIIDKDITVNATEYWGNLTLVDGGGTIQIVSDGSFSESAGGGNQSDEAVIIMRSSPGNTDYADSVTTQYLVKCIGRIRMTFTHTNSVSPNYPVRFIGLKEGSVIDFDFTSTDAASITETAAPDFYFYNRCVVRGSYRMTHTDSTALGGLWIRDINLGSTGSEYYSDIHLDGVYATNTGIDEAVAIYNTAVDGWLRCSGTVSARGSTSPVVTILNNNDQYSDDIIVSMQSVIVECDELRDGQGAFKIENMGCTVDSLYVVARGGESGATDTNLVRINQYDQTYAPVPKIGNAVLIMDGTFAVGDNVVEMSRGSIIYGTLHARVTPSSTTPKTVVVANIYGGVLGGDIASGDTQSIGNVGYVRNAVIRGRIVSTAMVEHCTIFWDTDDFATLLIVGSSGYPPAAATGNVFRFADNHIYASGTATPTQVIDNNSTDLISTVDYVLDYANAGGAPTTSDTYDGPVNRWRSVWRSGSTVTLQTSVGIGSAWVAHGDNPKATTSGTSVTFSSIPSWATEVKLSFNGVSTNAASQQLQMRLGFGATAETDNYFGRVLSGAGQTGHTTGFALTRTAGYDAADTAYGDAIIRLADGVNRWNIQSMLSLADDSVLWMSGGSKAKTSGSDALDRITITTLGGTATFDAGSISLFYR